MFLNIYIVIPGNPGTVVKISAMPVPVNGEFPEIYQPYRSDTHLKKKNIAPTFNCRYLDQMYRKIQQYKFLKHFLAGFILFFSQ